MFSQNLHADIYKDLSSKVVVADEYYPELIEEAHHINAETGNKFPFLFINDDIHGVAENQKRPLDLEVVDHLP